MSGKRAYLEVHWKGKIAKELLAYRLVVEEAESQPIPPT